MLIPDDVAGRATQGKVMRSDFGGRKVGHDVFPEE
jgi:hypothetical protein